MVALSVFTCTLCGCLPLWFVTLYAARHYRWNLYLKAYLSLETDIVPRSVRIRNVHFGTTGWRWWRCGASPRFTNTRLSAKRKGDRQWGEMTSVIKFVCCSLSAACQWMLVFVCPRKCVTQEKWLKHIDTCAFLTKKAKWKPWVHCLFPSDKPSKTVLFSCSLSITTCFVACQCSHSAPRPTSSLSGIKVAVIGVIILLYADSLSLNPLRSALCNAWLTCLRWCQVLAVSRRLPYATALLSPPMSVWWLSVWARREHSAPQCTFGKCSDSRTCHPVL